MKKLIISILTVMLSFTGTAYAEDFQPRMDVGSYTLLEEGCAYEVSDESAVVFEKAFGRPAYKFVKEGRVVIKHYHNGNYNNPPDVWVFDVLPAGEGFGVGKIESKVRYIKHTVGEPTTEDKLAYINKVLELVNIERRKAGVAPLKFSNELLDAATIRAEEITSYYSHTRPNGQPHSSLIKDGKYTVGENIAAGYTTPEEAVKGWMNSQGHRENILNSDYTEIGVGYAYKEDSEYKHYWVQMFKRPMSKAYRW